MVKRLPDPDVGRVDFGDDFEELPERKSDRRQKPTEDRIRRQADPDRVITKQCSFQLPASDYVLIRGEAANRKMTISNLLREQVTPLLERLRRDAG